MSSPGSRRNQLMQDLMVQIRYVSANSVMFSQAVAEKVGLHPTDNECLDFLILKGSLTAGQLSQLTGLSTGAVTAMIDRLESAGFVWRERDQNDRRRVIVIPNREKIDVEIVPYTMSMGTATEAICAQFSEEELETILKFITQANAAAVEEISKLRQDK
jgi:DNA-binding MarR family transcriptional regulator